MSDSTIIAFNSICFGFCLQMFFRRNKFLGLLVRYLLCSFVVKNNMDWIVSVAVVCTMLKAVKFKEFSVTDAKIAVGLTPCQ
jgi:hypothetical protein